MKVDITMALRALLIFSLLSYLSYSEKVEGRSFKKLSLKTIKTQFGDVYDCIDFYKQPAFDHPLLKNHTFHPQMRPVSFPTPIKESEKVDRSSKSLRLPDGGCPLGTVPIRRTIKNGVTNARLLRDEGGIKHRVVFRTKNTPTSKFNGGNMFSSIYNPKVSDQQYSSAVMTLRNGGDSIELGWTVNPGLYGDHKTRLYIDLVSPNSSCYNTDCPGFVIVSTEIPLGVIFDPVSKRGGDGYAFTFFIYRDYPVGNWWVTADEDNIPIGFWPERIFGGLKDLATSVEWGGLAYGPRDQRLPEMGSGKLAIKDPKKDGYCAKIKVVDEAHKIAEAYDLEVGPYDADYNVVDMGKAGDYQHLVVFGGPDWASL